MDSVVLTATPASLANSQESGGIRVDGGDILYLPNNGKLKPTSGKLEFAVTPRHSHSVQANFGSGATMLFHLVGSGGTLLAPYLSGTNVLVMAATFTDGYAETAYNITGKIVAGTPIKITIQYTPTEIITRIDGAIIGRYARPVNFGVISGVYFGSNSVSAFLMDAVFSAP